MSTLLSYNNLTLEKSSYIGEAPTPPDYGVNCEFEKGRKYVIASFVYDRKENLYELHFVGSRPFEQMSENPKMMEFFKACQTILDGISLSYKLEEA